MIEAQTLVYVQAAAVAVGLPLDTAQAALLDAVPAVCPA